MNDEQTLQASPEALRELLEFFKALADANRLKIVGLLAQKPLTVEQMAEMLNLRPSTVSNHLSYLSHVGLVSARAESYYNVYQLQMNTLQQMAQRLLKQETLPSVAANVDTDAYDRKVIANFTDPDGRIRAFPAQQKKYEAILRYAARAFEPGVYYSEKQVNEILLRYNDDTASLRRGLVELKLLEREGGGGNYWKPEGTSF